MPAGPPPNLLRSSILRRHLEFLLLWLRYRGKYMHLYIHDGRVNIDFTYRKVMDIRILRYCRLLNLGLYGSPISDWSLLKELDFIELDVGDTSFSDPELLRGKPLRRLELGRTAVSALDALEGMPLFLLRLDGTRVRDFSLLRSMPLRILLMSDCECSDLGFLRGMRLEHFGFTFTPHVTGIEHLMNMDSLEMISTSPYDSFTPSDFFDRYSRGLPLNEMALHYASKGFQIED
jgi:hypothetical protein